MSHADRDVSESSSKCGGTTPTGSVPSVLISAQVKAGCRELMERMPKEKKSHQDTGTQACAQAVMAAVFITPFCRQKPRGKSDWLQTGRQKGSRWVWGRTYWHSRGVKCQHAAEGRLRKGAGQMSMWFIQDKTLFLAVRLWFKVWCSC